MGLALKNRPDPKAPTVNDLKMGDIGVILDTEHPWFGQPFIVSKNVIVNLTDGNSHLLNDDKNYTAKPIEPGSTLQVEPVPDQSHKTLVDNQKLLDLLTDRNAATWLDKQTNVTISINDHNCCVKYTGSNGLECTTYRKNFREAMKTAISNEKEIQPYYDDGFKKLSDSELLNWLEKQPCASLESNSKGTAWTVRLLQVAKSFHTLQPWHPTIREAIQIAYEDYAYVNKVLKPKDPLPLLHGPKPVTQNVEIPLLPEVMPDKVKIEEVTHEQQVVAPKDVIEQGQDGIHEHS